MGIPLFSLLGSTPDSVRDTDEARVFIWSVKSKKKPGIKVRLYQYYDEGDGDKWKFSANRIRWKDSEFAESKDKLFSNQYSSHNEALNHGESKIKGLCDEDNSLSHCLDYF